MIHKSYIPLNQISKLTITRTTLFVEGRLTHLQEIQSTYSKVHHQDDRYNKALEIPALSIRLRVCCKVERHSQKKGVFCHQTVSECEASVLEPWEV